MNAEYLNIKVGEPRFCDIVIATRCVLRCKMCKAWQAGIDSNEITFEEAKKFVRSLASFVKEPLEINVMGGEPLLKDWCLDLCNFIHQQGFKSIISTNACLIDEDMAKKIAGSNLSVLAISLESLKAETHDFYRGVNGTFSKVMKAISYVDKYCRGRLAITILAIIMEKNLDDILELVEWVNDNDLFVNISFLALLETGLVELRHNWFKSPTYKELWPQDPDKVCQLIDELIKLRRLGYKIWNPVSQLEAFKDYYADPDKFMQETGYRVHDYIIDLDENGAIYLSGEPLGNIKEDDLKQLWFSGKANNVRRKIDANGPGKRCCVINFVCAFPPDDEYDKLKQNTQNGQTLGFYYFEKRQFEKAIEEFNKALKLNPKSEDIHQTLGFCYKELKQLDKAMEEFEYVLGINPRNKQGHLGFGFCYIEQGQIEKAMKEFNQALTLDSKDEHAHYGLGSCYQQNRQFDEAINEFRQVLESNPDNEQGYLGFGFCYLYQGQIEKAIKQFNHVLKLCHKNEYARYGLGLSYQYNKQFDKAIDEFKQVLEINRNSEYAHQGIAHCYESLKQFDKAIAEFTEALKINPVNEHHYQGLGCCYENLGQFDEAINEFRQVLEINPDNERAHKGLAHCYESLKQFDKAMDEFIYLINIHPDNEYYHQGLGCCYESLKQFDKAIAEFKKVLKINSDNEQAARCMASCYKQYG